MIASSLPAYALVTHYYLQADGVPKASLSTSVPGGSGISNYDPGRDDGPGLSLKKTNDGAEEDDPTKYQLWVDSSAGLGMTLAGQASFSFWSAVKEFENDKSARVNAYLLDCNNGAQSCALIKSGSVGAEEWGDDGEWIHRTVDFGVVAYVISPGRRLTLKITVDNDSDDDMWFAYGTGTYPSKLSVGLELLPTTTTTTTAPSTTTTTVATTTTTGPAQTTSTTTTTRPPPAPTSTTSSTTTTSTTIPDRDDSEGKGMLSAGPSPPPDTSPIAEPVISPEVGTALAAASNDPVMQPLTSSPPESRESLLGGSRP